MTSFFKCSMNVFISLSALLSLLLLHLTGCDSKSDSSEFRFDALCLNLLSMTISNIDWDVIQDPELETSDAVFYAYTSDEISSRRYLRFKVVDTNINQNDSQQSLSFKFDSDYSIVGCWTETNMNDRPPFASLSLGFAITADNYIQLRTQSEIAIAGDTSSKIERSFSMNTLPYRFSNAIVQISIELQRQRGGSEDETLQDSINNNNNNDPDSNPDSDSDSNTYSNSNSNPNSNPVQDSSTRTENSLASPLSLSDSGPDSSPAVLTVAAAVASVFGLSLLIGVIVYACKQYRRKGYETIPTYNDNPRKGVLRKISLRSAFNPTRNVMKEPIIDLSPNPKRYSSKKSRFTNV